MCPLFVATSYMFLLVTHYKIPPTIFPQAWVGNHEGRHLPETQRWKMSNLLHGPISINQILPKEKRVNRDIFGTSNLQHKTYGVSCDE